MFPDKAPARLLTPGGMIATVIGVIGVLVMASMLFARSVQIERVGADADVLVASQQVNTAASVLQANLGLYLVLRQADEEGLGAGAALQVASADLNSTVMALEDRIDDLRELSPRGASMLDATGIKRSIATIEAEDNSEVASGIARTEVRPVLSEIIDLGTGIRDGAASRIAAERSWAGTLTQLTSWAVALLIPMAALLVYRLVARRDLQAARLEERLAKEQEIVATKDQFLSNLSHELKTPLTSILGFTLAVDDSFEDPNTVDVSVLSEVNDLVLADAAKLTRMIEDLLVIDKADDQLGLVPETAPISWLIDESLDTFRRTGFDVVVEGEMEPVTVDAEAVKHILRNLIANAIAHGSPPVRIVGKLSGDLYFVEVRDNGGGVAEQRLETLFRRYVHEADQPLLEGSVGLGTAVAQKLAMAIGGEISYYRDREETVFSLRLPHVSIPDETAA